MLDIFWYRDQFSSLVQSESLSWKQLLNTCSFLFQTWNLSVRSRSLTVALMVLNASLSLINVMVFQIAVITKTKRIVSEYKATAKNGYIQTKLILLLGAMKGNTFYFKILKNSAKSDWRHLFLLEFLLWKLSLWIFQMIKMWVYSTLSFHQDWALLVP